MRTANQLRPSPASQWRRSFGPFSRCFTTHCRMRDVSDASSQSRTPLLLWGLLGLLFLISATYRVLDISERIGELRHGRELVREPFDVDLPGYDLVAVEEEAARAGLKPGDRITRLNDQRLHYSATDLWAPLRAARSGERLTVDATRLTSGQASTVRASIVLQPLRPGAPSAVEVTQFVVVNVLMPIVCTALGFWVAAVRVRDGRAWLLLFLMLSVAEFAGGDNFHFLYGRQDFFQPIAAAYQPVLANLWPTAMLLFAIYFPDRLPLDRRVPWVKWLVIAPLAVRVIGTNPVFEYVARRNPEAALALHSALEPTAWYVGPIYLLFILAFLAIMTSPHVHRTAAGRPPTPAPARHRRGGEPHPRHHIPRVPRCRPTKLRRLAGLSDPGLPLSLRAPAVPHSKLAVTTMTS